MNTPGSTPTPLEDYPETFERRLGTEDIDEYIRRARRLTHDEYRDFIADLERRENRLAARQRVTDAEMRRLRDAVAELEAKFDA